MLSKQNKSLKRKWLPIWAIQKLSIYWKISQPQKLIGRKTKSKLGIIGAWIGTIFSKRMEIWAIDLPMWSAMMIPGRKLIETGDKIGSILTKRVIINKMTLKPSIVMSATTASESHGTKSAPITNVVHLSKFRKRTIPFSGTSVKRTDQFIIT